MNDMAISENEAVRREYKSRTAAMPLALTPPRGDPLRDVNLYHRGADPFGGRDYGAGVGVEQFAIRVANNGRFRTASDHWTAQRKKTEI